MFKMLKLILLGMIICGLVMCIFFNVAGTPKDKIINAYDAFIQSFNGTGLTSTWKLQGKRQYGVDNYVGSYKADYDNYSGSETIFGGTALHRKNGEYINLKITVSKERGTVNIIAKLGNRELTLINDIGEYEDTIYIDGMSYYLTIQAEDFKGSVDIVSE